MSIMTVNLNKSHMYKEQTRMKAKVVIGTEVLVTRAVEGGIWYFVSCTETLLLSLCRKIVRNGLVFVSPHHGLKVTLMLVYCEIF
jgi:hypothetical protein